MLMQQQEMFFEGVVQTAKAVAESVAKAVADSIVKTVF
jgi:hypothetical protein